MSIADTFPAWWAVRPRVVEPQHPIRVPARDRIRRLEIDPLLRFIFYGERNPHPGGTFAWREWETEQRETTLEPGVVTGARRQGPALSWTPLVFVGSQVDRLKFAAQPIDEGSEGVYYAFAKGERVLSDHPAAITSPGSFIEADELVLAERK